MTNAELLWSRGREKQTRFGERSLTDEESGCEMVCAEGGCEIDAGTHLRPSTGAKRWRQNACGHALTVNCLRSSDRQIDEIERSVQLKDEKLMF